MTDQATATDAPMTSDITPGITPDTYIVERLATVDQAIDGNGYAAWIPQAPHAEGPYMQGALNAWFEQHEDAEPGRYRLLAGSFGSWTVREFRVTARRTLDVEAVDPS